MRSLSVWILGMPFGSVFGHVSFGPKILFDGRSDFTLVWENMVGIYE